MKIILIDDDKDLVNSLKLDLEQAGLEVVGVAYDGKQGLEVIGNVPHDVVITDIVMPQYDGFWLLENLPLHTQRIIVLSALSRDAFITKAFDLGADEYVIKPFVFDELLHKILAKPVLSKIVRHTKEGIETGHMKVDEKISHIFISVGIPAHIKGYQFLREAIKLTIFNPEIINSITKNLYPSIAHRFATSSSKVERAIRHAIEVAWNRGKIENINSLFGVKVYSQNDRPTNGEFIALIADKLLLDAM